MARLFISQERIDSWSAQDKIALDGDEMTLVDDGRSFEIEPAVYFVKVAGDEEDAQDLIGKVKTEEDVVALGGDVYMNSVILGEIAYDVKSGFVGKPKGG